MAFVELMVLQLPSCTRKGTNVLLEMDNERSVMKGVRIKSYYKDSFTAGSFIVKCLYLHGVFDDFSELVRMYVCLKHVDAPVRCL